MDDTTPKLRFVRIYVDEQRMDALLFDPILGDTRLIVYTWHEKNKGNVPPKTWHKSVIGEVQYQRGQELAKKQGRLLPRG